MILAGLGLLFAPVHAARAMRARKSHGSPRRPPGLPGRR
jgi:hypothetical protein